MTQPLPPALLAALIGASLALPGCCGIARVMCEVKAPQSPARGTRDSPEEAVDYLVDAFRNRRINDIYTSLHPDFRRENGGFTQEQFQYVYDKYEQDFVADAGSLAASERTLLKVDETNHLAFMRLVNASTGAEVVVVFMDQPKIRVVTKDDFVGTIGGPVEMSDLVTLSEGRLRLPADFPLTSIENVQPETVAGLASSDVLRVEIHHDWLVRAVPREQAKNIRFLDRFQEHLGK